MQLGSENFDRTMKLSDELGEHRKQYRRNHGIFGWILWLTAISVFLAFSIWGSTTGIIAGAIASIAVIVAGKAGRRAYCLISIHPKGIHGFNLCQKYLRKYSQNGPEFNKVVRSYWMRKWYYFLYSENSERWSWRPYALMCFLVLLLYWFPLIGIACLSVGAAVTFSTFIDLGHTPMALYLGSSSAQSHNLLKKIISVSGVCWVSLLKHDELDLGLSSHTAADDYRMDDYIDNMELMFRMNPWSIRCDEDTDWRTVVQDFILASVIIVIRPEISGPVQQEIEFLSNTEYLERIIVIRTDQQIENQLPRPLKKNIMDENEALDLIALTASHPRLFRKRLWGRANQDQL